MGQSVGQAPGRGQSQEHDQLRERVRVQAARAAVTDHAHSALRTPSSPDETPTSGLGTSPGTGGTPPENTGDQGEASSPDTGHVHLTQPPSRPGYPASRKTIPAPCLLPSATPPRSPGPGALRCSAVTHAHPSRGASFYNRLTAKSAYLLHVERREDLFPPEEHRSLGQSVRELRWVQPK